MCGIAGVVGAMQERGREAVRAMLDVLVHRGPDDEGVFEAPGVALGHRRLSILDLTQAGRQPMVTSDGRFALVMNGEIYNHAALRGPLETAGIAFRGRCDAETVLHHLAVHGERGLRDLRGMFALAFVDTASKQVFLARDRMGIKPLYWTETAEGFAFASESKALSASGFACGGPDQAAVGHLLSFYVVPAPWCAVPGVSAVRPGEVVRLEGDGLVTRSLFADVSFARATPPPSEEAARVAVREALEDAVRSHLMSDVTVGVFLSGGVDSGAVALLAAQQSEGKVPAFTLAFGPEGSHYDEAAAAAAIARHGGLPHHVRQVSGDEVLQALPGIVFAMDEPGASAIPNWFVAELAAEHGVKVCLSGLGGDELFAGYGRYVHLTRRERWFRAWRTLPGPLRVAVRAAARTVGAKGRPAAFLEKADLAFGERSYGYKLVLDDRSKAALWVSPHDPRTGGERPTTKALLLDLFSRVRDEHVVDQIAYVDAKTYLANDLLRHMDAMTMAHGVEARVPLLDGPLVDLAFSLSPNLRLKGDVRKHVLREAVRDLFPSGHLERPKMGFSFPMETWMREGPLRPVLDGTLDERSVRARGLFRPEAVSGLVGEFLSSKPLSARAGMAEIRVWTLVMLELWCRMFVDEGAPRSPQVSVEELIAPRK